MEHKGNINNFVCVYIIFNNKYFILYNDKTATEINIFVKNYFLLGLLVNYIKLYTCSLKICIMYKLNLLKL